jgi:uncharacterized protein (DUF488 family)
MPASYSADERSYSHGFSTSGESVEPLPPHAGTDRVWTIGHGARPGEELVAALVEAGVRTVVDVRRFPGSRRHPQFDQGTFAEELWRAGVAYRHAVELGGRRSAEPGEERFTCVSKAAFRSYAARMGRPEFGRALADALSEPAPCFLCAETLPWLCHRWLIAELLTARGQDVFHLIRPRESRRHRPWADAEARDGRLSLCGELVA